MNIKMQTNIVLNLLKTHREKHIEEYALQIQGWKKAMEDYAKELAIWRDNTPEDIFDNSNNEKKPKEPFKPVSYVKDYDKLIELIEHHVDGIIELEEFEFNQIVKDEFSWKSGFLAMTNTYSAH